MKIAYITAPDIIVSNRSNGVRSQAETWATILKKEGVEVDLVNNWNNYNWSEYDAIHFFGQGDWFTVTARGLHNYCHNICYSPIMDPPNKYFPRSLPRLLKDSLWHAYYYFRQGKIDFQDVDKVFVRSEFEKEALCAFFNIGHKQFCNIPLSVTPFLETVEVNTKKEPICLHISSIYQERKNVLRLVESAKKYGFELYLAGNLGTEKQFHTIKQAIGNSSNIHVLGYISTDEKVRLYQRAKVFALPSLCEGVGIVALDAALLGAEIAITNIPGPKEYYHGMAALVDPLDIDSIGRNIVDLLDGTQHHQPELMKHVRTNFCSSSIARLLISAYKK